MHTLTPTLAPTAVARCRLTSDTTAYRYRTPMKFGGRVVEEVTVLTVTAELTNRDGRTATGQGSMTMGVAWAWPDPTVPDLLKLRVVLNLAERMRHAANDQQAAGHPMEVGLQWSRRRAAIADEVAAEAGLPTPVPPLAILLAASPMEAALFDAHGKAAGRSSYQLLGKEHLANDLGQLLNTSSYRGLELSSFVSSQPKATMPLYHLVGALDPLTPADVDQPVGDGLPETLEEWIRRCELTHLKIKLAGDDRQWDLARVSQIDAVAQQSNDRGASTGKPWHYSLDFNERCENEEYVLGLLDDLHEQFPRAFSRVQYIEQPTQRDLHRPDAVTMHRAAQRVPVVIDESLTDLESLQLAVAQGYSGIALKACKGHVEALLLGAVAQHERLFLCVQDLTCVGMSLLHSASLAAHLPGVAAIESNGRQYCPEGNAAWMDRYGPMFEIRAGAVPTSLLDSPGLGYHLA